MKRKLSLAGLSKEEIKKSAMKKTLAGNFGIEFSDSFQDAGVFGAAAACWCTCYCPIGTEDDANTLAKKTWNPNGREVYYAINPV